MADLFDLPGFSWFIQGEKKPGNLQKQILCFLTERLISILWAKKKNQKTKQQNPRTKQYAQQKQM